MTDGAIAAAVRGAAINACLMGRTRREAGFELSPDDQATRAGTFTNAS